MTPEPLKNLATTMMAKSSAAAPENQSQYISRRQWRALFLQAAVILIFAAIAAGLHGLLLPTAPRLNFSSNTATQPTSATMSAANGAGVGASKNLATSESASKNPAGSNSQSTPESLNVPMLSVEETWALFQQAQVQFVDARRAEAMALGHVPGAVNLTPAMFAQGDVAPLSRLTNTIAVVIYCDGGECDSSKVVAKQLAMLGFSKLMILAEGYPGWVAAGHPVSKDESAR